jgi:hypothetical protein
MKHSTAGSKKPDRKTVTDLVLDWLMSSKKQQYDQGAEFFETLHDRGGDAYIRDTMNNPPDSMDVFQDPEARGDHVAAQLDDGPGST